MLFLQKNIRLIKFPKFREILEHFRETWRSCSISGDSRKFRETWQVCLWTDHRLSRETNLRLYKLSVCSSDPLLYSLGPLITVTRMVNGFNSRCLHVITGKDYRVMATTPVYDLVLAVRKLRMRYLGHVLRLPSGRIMRRSLIGLVKGGTYYPEGSLFSDCELESLEELINIATNSSAWRAKVASLA